jgi:hypothetical protein
MSAKSTMRKEKNMEAIERQKKYDALNIDEKISLVKSRGGESKKEIARLISKNK